jgi:hypothetical protein
MSIFGFPTQTIGVSVLLLRGVRGGGVKTQCYQLLISHVASFLSSVHVGVSLREVTRMSRKPVWGLLYPLKDTLPSVGKFQHLCFMYFIRLSTSDANECAAM